jgi:AraC family transcriptional regulator of adaptative response/methylated-DNA-[protein]-cysteine methyltransferase
MSAQDAIRVEQAIRFLEAEYRRQPPLAEVATAVGLSPHHFQRLFKRWAGVSPKRFLQFLTIEHAKAALAEGRSVLATSYEAGLSGGGRLHDLFVGVEAVTPGEFKERGRGLTISYGFHETPFGEGLFGVTPRGLCALAFVGEAGRHPVVREFQTRWPDATLVQDSTVTARTAQLVFASQRRPGPLTLDLRGTNFQIKVWEALLRIAPGTLVSYRDIARRIGRPEAHRAVGGAIARNPIAYLIPCHRVIQSTGAFGEYRWGAARKKAIIGWEAAKREDTRAVA